MTPSQLAIIVATAQSNLAEATSNEAAALATYRGSVLATQAASVELDAALQLTANEEDPPEHPPLIAPDIINNGDGTVSIAAFDDAQLEVWLFESSSQGWQGAAGGGGGLYSIESMQHSGRNVMARYFRTGPGAERVQEGEPTVLFV